MHKIQQLRHRLALAVPRRQSLLLATLGQVHHQEDDLVLRAKDLPAELSTLPVG